MTITICVHDSEGALEVVFVLEHFPINSGRHELLKVYDTVAIVVTLLDDLVPVDVVLADNLGVYHLLKFPLW